MSATLLLPITDDGQAMANPLESPDMKQALPLGPTKMGHPAAIRKDAAPRRHRYAPPEFITATTLGQVLEELDRPALAPGQVSFLNDEPGALDSPLWYAGNLDILKRPAVSIVGARDVSPEGAKRARVLAKAIGDAGVTVVSGLAKGVDVNAHLAALVSHNPTAAVIGTPLGQAYPAENAEIQEEISRDGLLISPFPEGSKVWPSNFPKRNRVMAALTDGSVIIEATDSSGTLHQAAECVRQGRWLFILKAVFEDPSLKWPRGFANYERMRVVSTPADVIRHVVPRAG